MYNSQAYPMFTAVYSYKFIHHLMFVADMPLHIFAFLQVMLYSHNAASRKSTCRDEEKWKQRDPRTRRTARNIKKADWTGENRSAEALSKDKYLNRHRPYNILPSWRSSRVLWLKEWFCWCQFKHRRYSAGTAVLCPATDNEQSWFHCRAFDLFEDAGVLYVLNRQSPIRCLAGLIFFCNSCPIVEAAPSLNSPSSVQVSTLIGDDEISTPCREAKLTNIAFMFCSRQGYLQITTKDKLSEHGQNDCSINKYGITRNQE